MRLAALRRDNLRALRLDVRFAAGLREPGATQRFEMDIVDLSVTGFRCETAFMLRPGHNVFVTIPSLGPLEATVMRRDGVLYGCAFDRPLHGAVFDHIAAQYRQV